MGQNIKMIEKKLSDSRIIKNIVSVSAVIVVAKLLGFMKQAVMASFFGATIETDLILLSQGLISNIDYLLVQVFVAAFIPVYIEAKKESSEKASLFVSNILMTCMIASVLIIAVLQISAPLIVKIIAPAYTDELYIRLIRYMQIFAPMILFIFIGTIFNALLRANERFVQGELVSVIQSVTVIVLLLLFSKRIGVQILAISYFAYTVINTFILVLSAKKEWRFRKSGKLFDEYTKKLMKISTPLFFGYAVVFINQQVDKAIISGLGDGVVTAFAYAAVLTNLITTLVDSICSVIFTYISQCITDDKEKEAGMIIRQSVILFTTILVPICTLIILNSEDIIRIVYGRGAFSDTAICNTALALAGYVGVVFFCAYRELFSNLQYSYMDSRSPMLNSTIGVISNIILSITLSKVIGIIGVAMATSISVAICSVLNVISSRKHNLYIWGGEIFKILPYWMIGVFICIFISREIGTWLVGNNAMRSMMRFGTITLASFTIYGLICFPVIKNNITVLNKVVKGDFL